MSEVKEEEKRPMTEEEAKAYEVERKKQKAELIIFYKGELPLLKVQSEYEEYLTRIDVAKMQRLEIMLAKAQMMAPPPEEGEEELNTQQND